MSDKSDKDKKNHQDEDEFENKLDAELDEIDTEEEDDDSHEKVNDVFEDEDDGEDEESDEVVEEAEEAEKTSEDELADLMSADEEESDEDDDDDEESEDEDEEEKPTGHEEAEKHLGQHYFAEEKLEVEHEKDDRLGITVPKEPWTNKTRFFGLMIIVVFFGGFGIWSYFAPIESAAIAPGKITVAGNRRTIQHLEGGIVRKIYVKDGSRVKKGQSLIKLDDTQAAIALQLSRSEVHELMAIAARLIAERNEDPEIVFPERLLKQKKDERLRRIMEAQQLIFSANKKTFEGNVIILKQRVIQLREQIKGIEAQLKSNTEQHRLILEEVQSVAELERKKLIEKPRLLELKREAAKLQGLRGENISEISVLKQKIGETQAQILTLVSNRRKEVLTELREITQKLNEELEKERAAADVLDRTDIRAPKTGTVVGLKIHTVGGVIKPGDAIMDIVPSADALVVEARVSPLDIDVVHQGLKARVQLTALKQRSTPALLGEVTRVSADIFTDQQSGESYYTARITIDPTEMEKLRGQLLYPGMPAQVMIITEKRTPLQYFIQPIKDSFNRAFREQ